MKTDKINPDDLLDVATFNQSSEAGSLMSALEKDGIEAHLRDENKLQRFWFMASPKAGIHVQVRRKDYEPAIKTAERLYGSVQKAVHCPSCSSPRVQYPALTRKNILPAFIGWLLVVLHLTEHKYYCEDCHYTWPQRKQDTSPTTILQ